MLDTTQYVQPPVAGPQVHRISQIGMRYALHAPEDWHGGPVVVAVHGISRNWLEVLEAFTPHCARAGAALIVPRFSRRGYRGYQRLRTGSRDVAADRALDLVLKDAEIRLGEAVERVHLFGFSGGAQFVHRYTLVNPDKVLRQVLTAAGFYTMPDPQTPFPYGLGATKQRPAFDLDGLMVPTKVFVGSDDTERDEDLRQHGDLDRLQGVHRVERATRFTLAVRAASSVQGVPPACSLEVLPFCDHSFRRCVEVGDLARRAVDFLLSGSSR